MNNLSTPGEAPHQSASPIELWDRPAVLKFFGGNRPLHVGTLYRGVGSGRYPKPVHVSGNSVRWIADECRAALARMIGERGEPTPPPRRGRPRRRVIDND
jgi:predicted DNA-binding transcriptional regulator AlpA